MSTLRRNQSEQMHFLLFKHQQYEIASHFQQIENIFPLFFAIFRIILFRINEVYLNINFKLKRKLHRLTYGEIIINGPRYGCIITTTRRFKCEFLQRWCEKRSFSCVIWVTLDESFFLLLTLVTKWVYFLSLILNHQL